MRTPAEQRAYNRAQDRRRRGARGYDGITDEQIYRRDKWVCMMPECACPDGTAIDPALQGTDDPWAPSIDHIIPLSGGGLDNARNKRAAHRWCNNASDDETQSDLQALARPGSGWTVADALPDTTLAGLCQIWAEDEPA